MTGTPAPTLSWRAPPGAIPTEAGVRALLSPRRRNAIVKAGFSPKDVVTPDDIRTAKVLVFPGVGAFGSAMETLTARGFAEPLKE